MVVRSGVRVAALVNGGFLPEGMRGRKLEGLTAVWDVYATFSAVAGADPTDHMAAAAGLPPIDVCRSAASNPGRADCPRL